jgi:hypothetical protein
MVKFRDILVLCFVLPRAAEEAIRLCQGPIILLHVIIEEEHNLKNYILAGGDTQIVDMVNQESELEGAQLLHEYKTLAKSKGGSLRFCQWGLLRLT